MMKATVSRPVIIRVFKCRSVADISEHNDVLKNTTRNVVKCKCVSAFFFQETNLKMFACEQKNIAGNILDCYRLLVYEVQIK